MAANSEAMSSWVDNGFEAARCTSPPPAVSKSTRTAVSAVTCRQAATVRPLNGRPAANSSRSSPSTGMARRAQAILSIPSMASGPDARRSVAVMIGLVRALHRDPDVIGLLLAQLGEPHSQRGQMQPRDSLVEQLGQHVHPERVVLRLGEQLHLGEHLI